MTAHPPGAPVAPSATPRTGRARAALVLAILVVAVSMAATVFTYLAPMVLRQLALPTSTLGLLLLPFQIAEIVLAIVALVLGIGPLAGPGPKGIAGMAVGVAGAWLISTAFSLLVGPLLFAVL